MINLFNQISLYDVYTEILADKIHEHKYIRSLKPLIA